MRLKTPVYFGLSLMLLSLSLINLAQAQVISPDNLIIIPPDMMDPPLIAEEIPNENTLPEVTRQGSRAVAGRLFEGMAATFSGSSVNANSGNKMAASADRNSFLPDDIWAVTNITQISNDQGAQRDVDIYQMVAGFDKLIGNFIVGSAITYAHNENEQGRTRTTGDTVGVMPYMAYRITDYLFASTALGYNYTHTNAVNNASDIDTNEFISETNLNLFKVIDSFIVKGRAGFRYKHTKTQLEKDPAGRDDSFDEITWIGDIEFGYRVAENFQVYTGLLYEYRDQEQSSSSALIHDGVGYMRYGAEYAVNKSLKLGAMIEHDINDEDNDFITGGFNARMEF